MLAKLRQAIYVSIDKESSGMRERGRPRTFDRDNALHQAMRLFWEKGFEAASMSDLTAAMGINAPSLYAAFGSKEKLFIEALGLYSASEGTEIWSSLETEPSAREAIERFLLASAESFSQPGKPGGCMIALEALHAGATSEALGNLLRDHRAWNFKHLEDCIRKGVAATQLSADIDVAKVANFYATVQHGMSIFARDGASREALKAVAIGAMAAWEGLTQRQGQGSAAADH